MYGYHEATALVKMVGPVNCFGTDEEDEFSIRTEDGAVQGIFKTWAVPVIPFLDTGRISILPELWPKVSPPASGLRFRERLLALAAEGDKNASVALDTLDGWGKRCVQNPLYLQRSLERARLNSWIADQRLCQLFASEPLASELPVRIRQLTSRLHLALGLLNPFYNLEALVGNPASLLEGESQAKSSVSGVLDVISFLLPAALRLDITAERLDWKGLSWWQLSLKTRELLAASDYMPSSRFKAVLLNVSRLAGIPPQHVLFAANVLEWIPRRVGGKADDPIATNDALGKIEEAVARHHKRGADALAVLSDMNALIRFLNWVPLIQQEENFQGKRWTYASVCDTTDDLLSLLDENPKVWRDGFGKYFRQALRPQLNDLDAVSAKGRFLLRLLLAENRLKEEFFPDGRDEEWERKAVQKVCLLPTESPKAPTRLIHHPSLVGGKPFHLALASQALGQEHVLEGFVITSDVIGSWLLGGGDPQYRIVALDQTQDLDRKLKLAREIRGYLNDPIGPGGWLGELVGNGLKSLSVESSGGFASWHPDKTGDGLWAVRSSTRDEAEARGVYETFLPVRTDDLGWAIRECIASYYSEAAVKFRMTAGAGDFPDFAVFCQPYQLTKKGGVATMKGGQYRISVGPTPAAVTSGQCVWDEICCPLVYGSANWRREFDELVGILEKLELMFGPVQIEWLVDPNGRIIILQLEFLSPSESDSAIESQDRLLPVRTEVIRSLEKVKRVEQALEEESGVIAIELDEAVSLDLFQGELLGLIVRCGRRIAEIKLRKPVSPSSHFANICRYFGIRIV